MLYEDEISLHLDPPSRHSHRTRSPLLWAVIRILYLDTARFIDEIQLLRSSLRPIARFVVEIQCFVCDRATPPIMEKLRSKGVAMHAYGVSAYYA